MRHYPIYIDLHKKKVVLVGGGQTALAKLRLLLKTQANIVVFAGAAHADLVQLADERRIALIQRDLRADDLTGAALLYAASEDDAQNEHTQRLGNAAGILTNVVDDLEASDFITPAIVDRSPVSVAIGTEGAAPVLARAIKAQIEEMLPTDLGTLAAVAKPMRDVALNIPAGRQRRAFWKTFFFRTGPQAFATGGVSNVRRALTALSTSFQSQKTKGTLTYVGTGPGDADLLTIRAHKVLHEADIIVHPHDLSAAVLELGRREAIYLTGDLSPNDLRSLASGEHIVRLLPGEGTSPATLAEQERLRLAGIEWSFIPGLPCPAETDISNIIALPIVAPNTRSVQRITA
jgi:uroporphyrin-III C-methyltransferase/precorrin-2 dehydrogenase/sirohydrochlorin ferrochelatase